MWVLLNCVWLVFCVYLESAFFVGVWFSWLVSGRRQRKGGSNP